MSKAKRLLDILVFVNAKRKFTAQEIADEFNISIRTVHRYILDLSEMGLPIYAEQGRNGGYTVLPNRLLPPILFTEEEAVAIFFAFQSLMYYRNLPFDAETSSVAQKLYSSLPSDTKIKIDKMRAYVAFWSPKRSIETPLLKEVLDAAIDSENLHIQYESQSGISTKLIRPIGVYAHDGLWYLPAYDYRKQKILLYRVDRIHAILSMEKSDDDFMNLEQWFDSNEVQKPIRLHVRLTMEGVRQCKSIPSFEGLIETNGDGSGYIDSDIDEGEIRFITPLFYRLGMHARILEPQALIDALCKQAKEILAMYQDEQT